MWNIQITESNSKQVTISLEATIPDLIYSFKLYSAPLHLKLSFL